MPLNDKPYDSFSNLLHVPFPLGSVVGDWCALTDCIEDVYRTLTWSRHDAAGVVVGVEGAQYADGCVERFVVLRPGSADAELTSAAARMLAAALMDAADSLDAIS